MVSATCSEQVAQHGLDAVSPFQAFERIVGWTAEIGCGRDEVFNVPAFLHRLLVYHGRRINPPGNLRQVATSRIVQHNAFKRLLDAWSRSMSRREAEVMIGAR